MSEEKEIISSLQEQIAVKENSNENNSQLGSRNPKLISCRVCGCKVLLPNKAELIERPLFLHFDKQSSGQTGETVTRFWDVRDMYTFENIAFSKTVAEKNFKYLTCADCEREVIGIHYLDDPSHFLLAESRVKYVD